VLLSSFFVPSTNALLTLHLGFCPAWPWLPIVAGGRCKPKPHSFAGSFVRSSIWNIVVREISSPARVVLASHLKGLNPVDPRFCSARLSGLPPLTLLPCCGRSLAHLRVHEVDCAYPEVPLLQLVDKGAQNRHVRVKLDLARAIEDLHPAKAQTVSQSLSVVFRLLLGFIGAPPQDNCRILEQFVNSDAATLLRERHSLLAQRSSFLMVSAVMKKCSYGPIWPGDPRN
jgi:hypothetical protein